MHTIVLIHVCAHGGDRGATSTCHVTGPLPPPLSSTLLGLLVALYLSPAHSQGRCTSYSCLFCVSQYANCTINDTTSTVQCSGDTSHCNVTQCTYTDNRHLSHCLASYYKDDNNLTAFRFTSGCISTNNCDSDTANCTASESVGSKEMLFNSISGIGCACYADNCTSSITYKYTVEPSLLPQPSASSASSPSITSPFPTPAG